MKRNRVIIVLLSIFVLSTLAGCGPSSGDGWLISSGGVGPYKMGEPLDMSLLETNGRPGCSYVSLSSEVNGAIGLVDGNNEWWFEGTEPEELTINVVISFPNSQQWGVSEPASAPARTKEGVGPGSTRGEVSAAYPDAVVSMGGYHSVYESLYIVRDGVPILFTFGAETPSDTDTVTAVFVGLSQEPHEWFCV